MQVNWCGIFNIFYYCLQLYIIECCAHLGTFTPKMYNINNLAFIEFHCWCGISRIRTISCTDGTWTAQQHVSAFLWDIRAAQHHAAIWLRRWSNQTAAVWQPCLCARDCVGSKSRFSLARWSPRQQRWEGRTKKQDHRYDIFHLIFCTGIITTCYLDWRYVFFIALALLST